MILRVPGDCFRVDPEDHPYPEVRGYLILQDLLHILNESQGCRMTVSQWTLRIIVTLEEGVT